MVPFPFWKRCRNVRNMRIIHLIYIVLLLGSALLLFELFWLRNTDKGHGTAHYSTEDLKEFLEWKSKANKLNKLPSIFMITPTYSRWTQKADLTRLCHTLMHVPNLHWIVVEDSDHKTKLVTGLLNSCKVKSSHLNVRTSRNMQMAQSDPHWLKHRGVDQRNLGLAYLRRNHQGDHGVVYFGDDDNTYSLELFEEMRFTKMVSVWPVALSGKLKWEGPVCRNDKVIDWYTMWEKSRPFPIDMAGFAVNLQLLIENQNANIDATTRRGYLESSLLQQLVTRDQLEPRADMCSKVLVWHTRTEVPDMKWEDLLTKQGKPSNPNMEV